jgi:PAS domain S-box-containing protein
MKAPLPDDERERLRALRGYAILDTSPEPAVDDIVFLAAQICETPIALVTLVDEARQWFKARLGFPATETSRDLSFCAHTILQPGPLVVPDMTADPRFADNPLVAAEPPIRFYAGIPLVAGGHALGALCVADRRPRTLAPAKIEALSMLSRQVVALLERRRADREPVPSLSRARVSEVLEDISDGFVTLDSDWRFTCVNHTAGELFARRPEELLGKRIWTELPECEGRPFYEACHRAARERTPIQLEEYMAPRDRWFEHRIQPSGDGLAIFMQEITGRKRAEETLRESSELYRQIISSVQEGIAVHDRNLRYLFWNPAMAQLTGVTAAEVLGRHPLEVFPGLRDEGVYANLQRAREGELVSSSDNRRPAGPGGRPTWTRSSHGPLCNTKGEIVGALTTVADITARKLAEEQLARSLAELRALSGRLQAVREEEQTRIAREIHDQLGQALTGIKMDASWLLKHAGGTDAQATRRLERMRELIDETIGNVRRISTELRPSVLDDLGLVAAVEWQLREFQKRSGIVAELTEAPEGFSPPPDLGTALFRVLQESLTNVLRHAEASAVRVALKRAPQSIMMTVEDNGRGIPADRTTGLGSLGLLGMRERVALVRGEFGIEPREEGGTRVFVWVPVTESTAQGPVSGAPA